jgi:N-acetylneuraminic acid mutarotase
MKWLALLAGVALLAGCGDKYVASSTSAEEQQGWTFAQSMSQRRSYIAAAQVGQDVYAAGGMVGETGRPLATFQRFDPAANSWTGLERLPAPVAAAAAAALGSTIYVTGGQGEGRVSGRQVWAYDTSGTGWRTVAPLPAPRFNHSAVDLGGKLYVLGGFSGGEEHDEVFAYDPARDAWKLVTHLPRPMHAFGAVDFRGEIWVIGGRHGEELLRAVWIFNPETGKWRRGPTMPKPMELLGAAVAGDQIHAIWESVHQVYDTRTGRWRQGLRSLVTRHALKLFYVHGALYTIGGCTTALHDSQVVERLSLR